MADRTINGGINSPSGRWPRRTSGACSASACAQLIDQLGENASADFSSLARRLVDLLWPHAEALDCIAEVERVAKILKQGTSADRQLEIYEQAIDQGLAPKDALARVKTWLQQETLAVC